VKVNGGILSGAENFTADGTLLAAGFLIPLIW